MGEAASATVSARYTSPTDSLASQAPSSSSSGSPTRRPNSIRSEPAFVESLGAGEQQRADPIERVVLASTMPEGLVLHPATHLVDTAVDDAHDVEQG